MSWETGLTAGRPPSRNENVTAALLHDIAKGKPDHALIGADILRRMGFGAVADIVAEHMDVTPEPDALLNEAEAPYLADKLTHGDRYGSLQTRSKYARERPVMSPEALRAVHLPHKNARNVQRRIERVLGRLLESVLREASSDIEDDRISHILDAAR